MLSLKDNKDLSKRIDCLNKAVEEGHLFKIFRNSRKFIEQCGTGEYSDTCELFMTAMVNAAKKTKCLALITSCFLYLDLEALVNTEVDLYLEDICKELDINKSILFSAWKCRCDMFTCYSQDRSIFTEAMLVSAI
jgi:hypothetical protein